MPRSTLRGGADAGERHAKLDEGDGDGGLHADHDGLSVQDAADGGDGAEHATDEGIDHFQGGDIDEDARDSRT